MSLLSSFRAGSLPPDAVQRSIAVVSHGLADLFG